MAVTAERLAALGGYNPYKKARKNFSFRRVEGRFRDPGDSVIEISEIEDILRRLDAVANELRDFKWRRDVIRDATRPVVAAARIRTPKSGRVHYVYRTNTVKFIKSKRAKRGSATEYRTAYYPGNLRLSVQYLERLKRTTSAIIGPRILRKASAKSYGKTAKRANGFYAQFIYGSAKAFRDNIMVPALTAATPFIIRTMDKAIKARTRKAGRRQNLAA